VFGLTSFKTNCSVWEVYFVCHRIYNALQQERLSLSTCELSAGLLNDEIISRTSSGSYQVKHERHTLPHAAGIAARIEHGIEGRAIGPPLSIAGDVSMRGAALAEVS
jgi:hypothetical protein